MILSPLTEFPASKTLLLITLLSLFAACGTTSAPRGPTIPQEVQVQQLSQATFSDSDRYAVGVASPGSMTKANWLLMIDLPRPIAGALSEALNVEAKAVSHTPGSDWWDEWDHARNGRHSFDHFFREQGYDGYLEVGLRDNGGRFNSVKTEMDFRLVRFTDATSSDTVFQQVISPPCVTVDAGNGLRYTDEAGCAVDVAAVFREALLQRLDAARSTQ